MIEKKVITARFGRVNPMSIDDYIENGGYESLKKALGMERINIIDEVKNSQLRGRGGAAFPTHIKLMAVAKQADATRYVVCNADEGEPGNFKDRHLIKNDPHQLIEGMVISAYAVRSNKGYIYIRGEYDTPYSVLQWTIEEARKKGFLGKNIQGSGFDFDIEIRRGAGSYICGEEFALLESIEGHPGRTRVKPPFPTESGLFGKPTLLSNVETFANIPHIVMMGGDTFAETGTESSRGTKLISLSGNVKNPGIYEVPFGVTFRAIVETLGGGPAQGREVKMVQLSGASGPIIPEYMLDLTIDLDRFETFNSKTGAGAIIVMDDRFDMFDILLRIARFFEHESCGKCTPCREGNLQIVNLLKKFANRQADDSDLANMESLARVMNQTSLCGLGQSATTAILSTLQYFRDDYVDLIEHPAHEQRSV